MKHRGSVVQISIMEELSEFLINDTLARSSKLHRLDERVRSAQKALRRLVDDDAWSAYLVLEEATNARAAKEVRLVFERMLTAFAYAISQAGLR